MNMPIGFSTAVMILCISMCILEISLSLFPTWCGMSANLLFTNQDPVVQNEHIVLVYAQHDVVQLL